MSFKTLSAAAAIQLDKELMSTGAYSIDQLMELAGLAVAHAIYKQYPPSTTPNQASKTLVQDFTPSKLANRVVVLVGPGNNGGDGLVAARHLQLWGGYSPVLYYPKKSKSNQLYSSLLKQLQDLEVPEISSLEEVLAVIDSPQTSLIIDSLFGFSFKPPIRDPFQDLIKHLAHSHGKIAPIVSIDIPSGWDVENGPVDLDINPAMLVSLTAPKPCAAHFHNENRVHYLGGRFINKQIAVKYGLEEIIARYKGDDQVVKL
ncbi:YjeF N-terminal domain-like protein [Suhomyces tanzawaensis NRRL Y-17324]|uniref:NAD(P)H-hydrate epimerase n=1 Tax=Suhomyces tanzawaensis NRRL Y-17324 TaxID=984487 RepID=A0A1E4SJ82_9ASCO|nr:YjeF N-terminal domain-like protein [Suhomyces tanzawaensis NRRL Y-17324]ODV79497.1 YjeF N-terminal domain-like protein [Suhomyces tanzawaensis NRRL Y-17324]